MDDHQPIAVDIVQVSSPDHFTLWNALSAETLAGTLRGEFKNLVTVRVHRIRHEKDISILPRVLSTPPHLLGLSVELGALEWTLRFLEKYRMLRFATENEPLIVFGNKLPTYYPEYFLDQRDRSVAVIGEGEESLVGLVDHLRVNRQLRTIPNLVFRDDHGQLLRTPTKPPDLRLLEHPPSTDTVAECIEHKGNVLIQASRGCSWSQCTYCTSKSFRKGKGWQGLPANRVVQNVERLVKAGAIELEFVDEEFLGGTTSRHLQRIYEIADGIERIRQASGKDITFRVFLIPNTLYKEGQEQKNNSIKSVLQRLKEVGLVRVYFGAESGCASQLLRYRRGYTLSELEKTIRLVRDDLELEMDVGFIMFDPELTLDELRANLGFFRKWNLVKHNQWPFRPLAVNPETPIKRLLEQSGELGTASVDLMSYDYEFKDARVKRIHSIIETVGEPSSNIFYALKVVSKRQFSKNKKDKQTLIAQEYVEQNAEVMLDLIEALCTHAEGASLSKTEDCITIAQQAISDLVSSIKKDLQRELIVDDRDYLHTQILRYESQCYSVLTALQKPQVNVK